MSSNSKRKGFEIFIRGTVQGVGFRPFIYNLACRLNLSGTVANTGDGVVIHVACSADRLDLFLESIKNEAPPLSRITSISSEPSDFEIEENVFSIVKSSGTSSSDASVPPDIATCNDCLGEMFDKNDPRYNYPFINCTNCGPRFTIIEKIPYDRPCTSMKVFPMCEACKSDYEDPANRRFHAQPNACGKCGPEISWHDSSGKLLSKDNTLKFAAEALATDKIIGIRGLGGFHLSCSGFSNKAVATLRARKARPDKPLAIMVATIDIARKYCEINQLEEKLLNSIEHPVVLLKKKATLLADNLAPNLSELGVMIAYTPLHHLLFKQEECPEVLVMTSGNLSGLPICTANDDAIDKLGQISDNFLLHNREIITRIDDSVTRVTGGKPLILRRSRGYVPSPIQIEHKIAPIIGCGGDLKSTFCLGKKNNLYISQHIGDLFNLESYDFFIESIEHLKSVFEIEPEIAVCDMHPDYMSTRYAEELGLPLYRVQHHHAHATAVMAEHHLSDPVLAVILDGTGYGTDGTSWGGEILKADFTSFERLGHLSQLKLPGGDIAAKEPWRMGISSLFTLGGNDILRQNSNLAFNKIEEQKRNIVLSMLENNFNSPLTSSCGRLFDAISSILGICQTMSYEGQAAMELEDRARRGLNSSWKNELLTGQFNTDPFLLDAGDGKWEISSPELIKSVLDKLKKGHNISEVASHFHFLLIRNICDLLLKLREQTGLHQVVLSGGCMQNAIILEGLTHMLVKHDLQVFTGENIPINDGGISLGQTITGGMLHVSRSSNEGNQG